MSSNAPNFEYGHPPPSSPHVSQSHPTDFTRQVRSLRIATGALGLARDRMGFEGSGGVGGAAESDEGGDQQSYGIGSDGVPRRAVQVRVMVASSCVWRQMREMVAMVST
ncbi:hypothetical protein C1H46_005166 [Malus baccata]|uniref:Uncharacterized protein n=1 Tax=Malus baccata TaxID=106549 RepID=A0A540NDX9_MALBA|nr:hypothetical protein C1H46_005166 [Malus baccata]